MDGNKDRWKANDETRKAWNESASFWDDRMGEGNDFVDLLVWPATLRLLAVQPNERILDVACGNGLSSRRLAALGAKVVACDFSTEMLARARERTVDHAEKIRYQVVDATDESALLALGEGSFHAALCQMALFDMADIRPLMRALTRLLRPGGRFVFSVIHPCFNNPHAVQMAEMEDREGEIVTVYSVKVTGYITESVMRGVAMLGQPRPHLYFHRPLHSLLGAGLDAGFVLDGFEERAFPPEHPPARLPLSWSGKFSEIPPALVARMRVPARVPE